MHQTYRDLREIIFRFHNGRNPAPGAWCYLFTQNSLPLRQDTAGTTDDGNVFAAESSVNERNLDNERHLPLGPQGDNRKNAQPTHSDSSLNRSPQIRQEEPDLPQPSGPFGEHPPQEPRESRRCPACGSRTQVPKNHSSFPVFSLLTRVDYQVILNT